MLFSKLIELFVCFRVPHLCAPSSRVVVPRRHGSLTWAVFSAGSLAVRTRKPTLGQHPVVQPVKAFRTHVLLSLWEITQEPLQSLLLGGVPCSKSLGGTLPNLPAWGCFQREAWVWVTVMFPGFGTQRSTQPVGQTILWGSLKERHEWTNHLSHISRINFTNHSNKVTRLIKQCNITIGFYRGVSNYKTFCKIVWQSVQIWKGKTIFFSPFSYQSTVLKHVANNLILLKLSLKREKNFVK